MRHLKFGWLAILSLASRFALASWALRGGEFGPALAERCRELGRAIAASGCCLLTGVCPGLPLRSSSPPGGDGHLVGIRAAFTLREHVETFGSPNRDYDVLIFTELGLMGRELVNIHSSDIVIVVGGRSGTLGEFAIAYEQGKLIGVLEGTGGITDALPALEASLNKQTGSEVLYDSAPSALVSRLLERYTSDDYTCPGHPASTHDGGSKRRRSQNARGSTK